MCQVMKVTEDFFVLKIGVFSEVELLVCMSFVHSYFFCWGGGHSCKGISEKKDGFIFLGHPLPNFLIRNCVSYEGAGG